VFKIVPTPTFTCPVLLSRPDADAPVKVDFVFRHKGVRDLTAWLRRAQEGGFETDVDFIAEVVDGWGPQIVGADDKPEPYTPAALGQLLDRFPGAGAEIVFTYRKRLKDARLGN
jgi:hypothetical protein